MIISNSVIGGLLLIVILGWSYGWIENRNKKFNQEMPTESFSETMQDDERYLE